MKKKMGVSIVFLFCSLVSLVADDSLAFNFTQFDMTIPGNGYFFSCEPNLGNNVYKISLLTGYGQIFQNDAEYLDTLLYRSGLRFQTSVVSVEAEYAKTFTKLAYAYFHSQKGISGNVSLSLPERINTGYDFFYGELSDSINKSNFFYQLVFLRGIEYLGLASDISWLLSFSNYRDFDLDSGKLFWGTYSAINISLADDFFNTRLSMGYVENTNEGLSQNLKFDFAMYSPGLKQNLVSGETAFVLENKVRIFPFRFSYTMPSFLEMLYLGGLYNLGYFLPKETLVKDGTLTYYAGASLGFLFFKSDVSLSFAYCPQSSWVLQFRMIQKNL